MHSDATLDAALRLAHTFNTAAMQQQSRRRILRGIRGVVAELESDETSQRTYKRHLYRATQGKWRGGPPPYGTQPDGHG